MGEDYKAREAQLYAEQCAEVDIIITTALIPGRPAPRMITGEMVAAMKPGSVIVDMAAANGGNVEGTVAGEKVVTANGVTIIGYTDLAGRLPAQASQLYGTNLVNLMKLLTPGKDGQAGARLRRRRPALDDGGARRGEDLAAASGAGVGRAGRAARRGGDTEGRRAAGQGRQQAHVRGRRYGIVGVGRGRCCSGSPRSRRHALIGHLVVFALAIVIGYYVIGHVHHALHTPLMSVTNAISGIIVVGALLQIGHDTLGITIVAALAILLATINVFGGFAVTRRMLAMFRRS